jgi:quercetin dioxygenase-like cupin family protein
VKRHPALVPLSHDHHHGLVQARRLLEAAGEPAQAEATRTFLRFFGAETLRHFREEEELLFPRAADAEEAREPIARALLEHQRVHALVARLAGEVESGEPAAGTMRALAELLETHIRFEERELFPLLERLVPDLAPAEATERRRRGPIWGAESEDLNATLLEWGAGDGTETHVNEERDVLVVVLEGSAEVTVDDRESMLLPGELLLIEKGRARRLTAGPEGVRYLSVHRRRPPLQIAGRRNGR